MKTLFHRFAAALMLALCFCQASHAVLKEKNFEQTLNVLRAELERSYLKQKAVLALYEQRTRDQHDQLVLTMQKCNQISLILYSQRDGFTFDMAYACQQATDIYNNIQNNNVPYEKIRLRMKNEVDRYDLLITSLEKLPPAINRKHRKYRNKKDLAADTMRISQMHQRLDSLAEANGQEPFTLDADEQQARKECLIYAKALRNNMARLMNQIEKDTKHYEPARWRSLTPTPKANMNICDATSSATAATAT